jgi:hypothetical protein
MTLRVVTIGALITLLLSQHSSTGSKLTPVAHRVELQKSTQLEARRIWEQAVAAKGGRELLRAVENFAVSTSENYTTGSGKTNKARTEAFFVFPNKVWRWTDLRPDVFGLSMEVLDFDNNTRYLINSDNTPPVRQTIPPMETRTSQTRALLAYLLETKWLKPELLSTRIERIGPRTVDVVRTVLRDDVEGFAPEGKYIDFAFDRATHLLIRVSYYHSRGAESVLDVAENFSDYTEVSGIRVPQKRRIGDSIAKIHFQINVAYNEDIFRKPPRIAAGPEAWRAKP